MAHFFQAITWHCLLINLPGFAFSENLQMRFATFMIVIDITFPDLNLGLFIYDNVCMLTFSWGCQAIAVASYMDIVPTINSKSYCQIKSL